MVLSWARRAMQGNGRAVVLKRIAAFCNELGGIILMYINGRFDKLMSRAH
jgi:hypothetical protein